MPPSPAEVGTAAYVVLGLSRGEQHRPAAPRSAMMNAMTGELGSGVGNVFYFVNDLAAATQWYAGALGRDPVVTAEQLVAFEVGGVRLTLHVDDEFNTPGPSGTVAYWTVPDVDAFVARWEGLGARAHRGPKTVFTGERLCQLLDPFGNLFGVRQADA